MLNFRLALGPGGLRSYCVDYRCLGQKDDLKANLAEIFNITISLKFTGKCPFCSWLVVLNFELVGHSTSRLCFPTKVSQVAWTSWCMVWAKSSKVVNSRIACLLLTSNVSCRTQLSAEWPPSPVVGPSGLHRPLDKWLWSEYTALIPRSKAVLLYTMPVPSAEMISLKETTAFSGFENHLHLP